MERPPGWARWFVRGFLIVFVVCGLVGIEAWPFTGFRLFSHLRTQHRTTWQAFSLDAEGRENVLSFAQLPSGYRGFVLIMQRYPDISPTDRDGMCRAWAEAAGTSQVRVYRLDEDVLPRAGSRPASPTSRTLLFTCGEVGNDSS